MATRSDIPELHVEGKDDLHTIIQLLRRHGVEMAEAVRPFKVVEAVDVVKLLEKMPEAIAAASSRPVGFVLDIDIPIVDRWAAVRNRLGEAEVDAPDSCPLDGFIGRRKDYPKDVGVWLMPDCSRDGGTLEHLLETLIPAEDKIWPHVRSSTRRAREIGAKFSEPDCVKAEVHCWLSWQSNPGKPFGTAINARFFEHDSPEALAFLDWLRRLYQLPSAAQLRD